MIQLASGSPPVYQTVRAAQEWRIRTGHQVRKELDLAQQIVKLDLEWKSLKISKPNYQQKEGTATWNKTKAEAIHCKWKENIHSVW